jgi:hypothetical protein
MREGVAISGRPEQFRPPHFLRFGRGRVPPTWYGIIKYKEHLLTIWNDVSVRFSTANQVHGTSFVVFYFCFPTDLTPACPLGITMSTLQDTSDVEKHGLETTAIDGEPKLDIEQGKIQNTLSHPTDPSIGPGKVDDLIIDTVNAETEYTPEQFRKLRWKIDLFLLPLMWVCYGTQQSDKTAVSVQAVFGMRTDTHLVGQQFSCGWCFPFLCLVPIL